MPFKWSKRFQKCKTCFWSASISLIKCLNLPLRQRLIWIKFKLKTAKFNKIIQKFCIHLGVWKARFKKINKLKVRKKKIVVFWLMKCAIKYLSTLSFFLTNIASILRSHRFLSISWSTMTGVYVTQTKRFNRDKPKSLSFSKTTLRGFFWSTRESCIQSRSVESRGSNRSNNPSTKRSTCSRGVNRLAQKTLCLTTKTQRKTQIMKMMNVEIKNPPLRKTKKGKTRVKKW